MPLMKALMSGTTSTESLEISADMFDGVVQSFTNVITPEVILGVIGTVLAAGIVFVFTWWGARKVAHGLTKSFLKGKISI